MIKFHCSVRTAAVDYASWKNLKNRFPLPLISSSAVTVHLVMVFDMI